MTERVLVSDIDGTLLRDGKPTAGLETLRHMIEQHEGNFQLIYATGRTGPSTLGLIREGVLPPAQAVAALVGTEVWMPDWVTPDAEYGDWITEDWDLERVRRVAQEFADFECQPEEFQSPRKLSYFARSGEQVRALEARLRSEKLNCMVIHCGGRFVDLIPARAGKRAAVEFILPRLGAAGATVLAAGDSLNDRDLLEAPAFCSVIVANADDELIDVVEGPRLHEAELPFAAGVLEGAEVFDFWGHHRQKA